MPAPEVSDLERVDCITDSQLYLHKSKEKSKHICDNNKDLIEYHKNDLEMQELPLERN